MKKNAVLFALTLGILTQLSAVEANVKASNSNCKMMKMQERSKCMAKVKKVTESPFLIKRGLPHLSAMVMQNWDDTALALNKEQQNSLTAVREHTMGEVGRLKNEILPLRVSITSAVLSGTSSAQLKEKVEKLAQLEAEATMVHIKCIEDTKNILSKDQMIYLMQTSQFDKE